MPLVAKPRTWRFKLRTILLAVTLMVLVVPVAGIYVFRIYEGELVKQTELELISQAAWIAALYKSEIETLFKAEVGTKEYGVKIDVTRTSDEYYRIVKPQLNLSTYQIKSRPPDAAPSELPADRIALEVGTKLLPVLLDAQRTTLAGVRILDFQGIVIGGRDDIGKSLSHLPEIQEARGGRYSSAIRERNIRRPRPALASLSRGTGIRVFVAYPITAGDRLYGVVFLSRTPSSILEHLFSQKEKVALVAGSILLIVTLLVVLTSYSIARPLYALIDQIKGFASGDEKALKPLPSPVTEEVALLSQSFIDMARSLEHRAEYIRSFATHVSHEFKTPLTAIQGAIELLEEHSNEMPTEKRLRFLRNIGQDADRLKRLVERLLEMARADVLQPAAGETVLAPLAGRIKERYKDRGLSVSFAGPSNLKASVPSEILETVLTNLCDNSRQNGADHVEITCESAKGSPSILVADNGRGISPANAEKIFTPFFTTRRDEGGTGLGLGIVRSLLKAYGGAIDLAPSEKGAAFRVMIPLGGEE